MAGKCAPWCCSVAMSGVDQIANPPNALIRGNLKLLNQLSSSQPLNPYCDAYSLWGSVESHLILPPLIQCWGFSLPGFVPPDVLVISESVVGIKPGDSCVVIGYQDDDFTHTLSAEHFLGQLHIHPGFKVRCQH